MSNLNDSFMQEEQIISILEQPIPNHADQPPLYASMQAFKQSIIQEFKLDEKITGEEVLEFVKKEQSNPIMINIIEEYIDNLSIGISNLINIFEPEAIGIGGSFVYYEDILLPKLKEKLLNKYLLFNRRENLVIKAATLGNDAGIIGTTLIK